MAINHKRIICTVTNDLSQDQRMYRICNSLSQYGYQVTLVGRKLPNSLPLKGDSFSTRRLSCYFSKGFLFYLEFNVRLFFFLCSQKVDIMNSVDLDTLPAGRLASWIKKSHFTFDAHELFTEVPELNGKQIKKLVWKSVERLFIRGTARCYTVNESVASELKRRTKWDFAVVQNYPLSKKLEESKTTNFTTIELVYQGMLNKGRGLEELIAAVGSQANMRLNIIGRGDLEQKLHDLSKPHSNIIFHGFIESQDLHRLTKQFHIGLNLLSDDSANYYYSSANKFFDFIMAGLPVISMNYPEYQKVNEQFELAVLMDDLKESSILSAIEAIVKNYETYATNCHQAAAVYNWESQEGTLKSIYDSL